MLLFIQNRIVTLYLSFFYVAYSEHSLNRAWIVICKNTPSHLSYTNIHYYSCVQLLIVDELDFPAIFFWVTLWWIFQPILWYKLKLIALFNFLLVSAPEVAVSDWIMELFCWVFTKFRCKYICCFRQCENFYLVWLYHMVGICKQIFFHHYASICKLSPLICWIPEIN